MSPHGEGRGRGLVNLVFEVILIAIGVFLALLANNWHEDRENHAKARDALRNFLTETQTNLQATQSNRDYHEKLAQELDQVLHSPEPLTEERLFQQVHFAGAQPVTFEHTAWDLALATQALSYLPSDLAFEISKTYTQQAAFQTVENTFLAAGYMPGALSSNNAKGFAAALLFYLRDVNLTEPAIISQCEKVLPKLKAALDDTAGH